jgi:hypothetical protein
MRTRLLGLGLGLAVATTGCLVDVDVDHTGNPGAAFAAAKKEAERAQGQSGKATEVHVLVYDPKDGELVRVAVPVWLAKKFANDEAGDSEVPPQAAKGLRLALEQAGKGVMVEVQEDSGEQVLVWLR